MAKKVASFRLDSDILGWVAEYAVSRKASQAQVIEAALLSLKRDAEGGVPDLPVADTAEVRAKRAEQVPGVVRARSLSPADPLALARQAKLNKARG